MTAIPHSLLNISLKSETLFFNRVPPFQRTKGLLPPEHEKKSWRLSLLLHSCFALYWRIRMHLKRHFICVIRHAEWEIAPLLLSFHYSWKLLFSSSRSLAISFIQPLDNAEKDICWQENGPPFLIVISISVFIKLYWSKGGSCLGRMTLG